MEVSFYSFSKDSDLDISLTVMRAILIIYLKKKCIRKAPLYVQFLKAALETSDSWSPTKLSKSCTI